MSDGFWLSVYTYLMPSLAGCSLLNLLCRIFALWQRERSARAIAFLCVHASLFVLFSFFSLYARMTPLVPVEIFLPVTTAGYVLLALSLAFGGLYDWRDLVAFLREKDETAHPAEPDAKRMTLDDLAKSDVSAALDATPVKPEG